MITGRDIVLISSIDWNFPWQGPQEITLRLARAGNHLLYIENTGVRAPGGQLQGDATRAMSMYIVEERQRSSCPPGAMPSMVAAPGHALDLYSSKANFNEVHNVTIAHGAATKCQVVFARALRREAM